MGNYVRLGSNKRDSRGNIIYYESREGFKKQYVLKHYQEFDEQNRKVKYYNSDNRTDIYHYKNDKVDYIDRYEYNKSTDNTSYSRIEYNKYGQINMINTYIFGTKYTHDYNKSNIVVTISPFIKQYDYPSPIF